jgi:hypothetical protein
MRKVRQREARAIAGGDDGGVIGHIIASDRKAVGFRLFETARQDRCIGIHVYKAARRRRQYTDGHEMEVTLEEAMDFGLQLVRLCMDQPDTKKRYERWVKRGKRRAPSLQIVRGGADSIEVQPRPPEVD